MRSLIISLAVFALLTILLTSAAPVWAQNSSNDNNSVILLQPDIVGGQKQESSLGHYLSLLFETLIGLVGGISVLYIVIGGLQYILSEVPGIKTSGKQKISEALIGLILALAAWLILNTINPDLVNLNLEVKPVGQTTSGNQ